MFVEDSVTYPGSIQLDQRHMFKSIYVCLNDGINPNYALQASKHA